MQNYNRTSNEPSFADENQRGVRNRGGQLTRTPSSLFDVASSSFADENQHGVRNSGGPRGLFARTRSRLLTEKDKLANTNESFGLDNDYIGEIKGNTYEETRANLSRAEWEDYRERFLPVQNQLIGLATSNELLDGQLDRNKRNLETSFASSERNEAIGLARFGQTPTNSRQDSNNRQLQESLTTASVNNETRTAVDDLQSNIMTGQSVKPRSLAEIGTN